MFYGSVAEADSYHAARGHIEWAGLELADKEAALLVASEYLDNTYGVLFDGYKTGQRAQVREWPRTNAYDVAGYLIGSDEIPREVTNATYELALRQGVEPGSLSPDYDPADTILEARVEGAVSVKFADSSSADGQVTFTVVDGIIAPLLTATVGGTSALSGRVVRG